MPLHAMAMVAMVLVVQKGYDNGQYQIGWKV